MSNILFWDVETSLMKVYTFGLYKQDIPIENIIDDWHIICASWKFLGDDQKVQSVSVLDLIVDDHKKKDLFVVMKLHEALTQADIIVAHNGDAFDLKKFNARAIYHGLKPIPPKPSVDTLKEARRNFKFTSNKLDYINQYLGIGGKTKTSRGLWIRATEGDREAIEEMVSYNKDDVTELEKTYLRLRPYMTRHPNINLFENKEEDISCPKCGSHDVSKRGVRATQTRKYQRYQCKCCNGWFHDTRMLKNNT